MFLTHIYILDDFPIGEISVFLKEILPLFWFCWPPFLSHESNCRASCDTFMLLSLARPWLSMPAMCYAIINSSLSC